MYRRKTTLERYLDNFITLAIFVFTPLLILRGLIWIAELLPVLSTGMLVTIGLLLVMMFVAGAITFYEGRLK